jgi:hypothetical protein
MITESQKDALRRQFLAKAEAVFDRAMERGLSQEDIQLSEIEEIVNELKFELTGELVEDIIQGQANSQPGPGPRCEGCGREMRYKGHKKRPAIQTSQGEIELERAYYYCDKCKVGLFPPGSAVGDQ